ncbi:MAG: hypothetical protein WBC85_11365 [Planktotalea sp.]|uniref:hypothetical protein n=1 Tax=Planktotalea sp. TaxID=2029877 RepID=UPI003C76F147
MRCAFALILTMLTASVVQAGNCSADFNGLKFCGVSGLSAKPLMKGSKVHSFALPIEGQTLRVLLTIERFENTKSESERMARLKKTLQGQTNILKVAYKSSEISSTEPELVSDWLIARTFVDPKKTIFGRERDGVKARYLTGIGCGTAFVTEQFLSETRGLEQARQIEDFILEHAQPTALQDKTECQSNG